MNRADVAAYLGARLGTYLGETGREAADTDAGLRFPIDDSLYALGYSATSLPSVEMLEPSDEEDWRIQAMYRALVQIVRDLGANMDVSVSGDSYRLSQIRKQAQEDMLLAQAAVLDRFGTLGTVIQAEGDPAPFITLNLDYLLPGDV